MTVTEKAIKSVCENGRYSNDYGCYFYRIPSKCDTPIETGCYDFAIEKWIESHKNEFKDGRK